MVTNQQFPQDIALDLAAGKMYWPDSIFIKRANLDGSAIQSFAVSSTTANPLGIALDTVSGKVYWVDPYNKKIQRANFDGTGIEDLVTTGLDTPWGIALALPPSPPPPPNQRPVANAGSDQTVEATDRKSTRLNSSHIQKSRMPSSA